MILPLLPNRGMGYLGVINPFRIWLMVAVLAHRPMLWPVLAAFAATGTGAAALWTWWPG